jgi:ATP-dependent Clp protease, protease subunit
MKTWFSIKNLKTAAGSAEIDIFDEIGYGGIRAGDFLRELRGLGDVKNIKLRINSPGGEVFDGIAIYNALRRHPAQITVEVYGIAASIASIIAMAGDRVVMPANTFMFVHDPLALVVGDADDMRQMADSLEKIASSLIQAYVEKTGKGEDEVKKWMADDTWFTAAEALEAGLADEVIEEQQIAAFFDLRRFHNAPPALLTPDPSSGKPPLPVSPTDRFDFTDLERLSTEIIDYDRARNIEILKFLEAADSLHLAVGFIEQRLSIDMVKANIRNSTVDEVKEIYRLCTAADVADLAPKFIDEGRKLSWVQDRLKHVADIRARCVAAKAPERAEHFIRANARPEEVGDFLLELMRARDPVEIDNHVPMDSMMGARSSSRPLGSKAIIDSRQIYENYRKNEARFLQPAEKR